ncbi:hypothetical protein [Pseudalkalibacillus decolorationis]|uniref:hypothetical protein n=1 Tax=Pseudalkalibacillus decolorationis TaxID=163879 RepID=UPI0021493C59|nr:hypothetical protein [Pseudalkalibacillus decolorationis]
MKSQVLTEVILKRRQIPKLLSDLSYINQEKAVKYLRIFANKELPVTPLYEKLIEEIDKG